MSSTGSSPFGPLAPLFGGASFLEFGFDVPQGDPAMIQMAAREARDLGQTFTDQVKSLRAASQVALGTGGGWQGAAASSFAQYAGNLTSVTSANAGACETAAGALSTFATELEAAQRVTTKALADCQHAHDEYTTQHGLAQQAQDEADTANQNAANALHPSQQTAFQHQATEASGRAGTASTAAGNALDDVRSAERQGRTAYNQYQDALRALEGKLGSAAGQFRQAPVPAGGTPVPLTVTAADAERASALIASAGGAAALLQALSQPGGLNRIGASNLTPGTALALLMDAEAEIAASALNQSKPKPHHDSVLGWLGHQVAGVGEGAWSATKGTVGLVIHPSRLAQTGETLLDTSPLYQMVVNGKSFSDAEASASQTQDAVLKGIVDWHDLSNGNYGRALGTIGIGLIGTKGVGEVAGRVGALARDGATVAEDGGDAASAARGGAGPVRQGQAGVDRTIKDLEAAGGSVRGAEVTVESGGVRVRIDLYAQLPNGQRAFIEVKTGATAGLNARQAIGYPSVIKSGGVAYGQRAAEAGFVPGRPFPPTQVWVVHQPWPLP
ncbi:MAG TPA: hypothetical protein VGF81_00580 [Solirubrobacteraceae bacterium]|jgi:hypothetical protein